MFLVGKDIERIFLINVNLYGFEVIDVIKVVVEKVCFNIVFCVDILVYVFCDMVRIIGGLSWKVYGGWRDGLIFNVVEVV